MHDYVLKKRRKEGEREKRGGDNIKIALLEYKM